MTGPPPSGGGAPPAPGTGEEPPSDPEAPVRQAREVCLRLLARGPRTRRQLADALRRRAVPAEIAESVLGRFEDAGLIDDTAFAAAWVESRHHSRGLARPALARELRTRGVEPEVIDGAMERLDAGQEEGTARALVDRRLAATRDLDTGRRVRRLAGMLARRGYGEGVARRVIRQALEDEGRDAEELESHLPD